MNNSNGTAAGVAGLLAGGFILIVELAVLLVIIIGLWKVFTKAGKPGWASIIPIYNLIVLLEISGKPLWWIILCIIPCVNIVVFILIYIALAKSFGQGTGFGIGMFIFPFIFIPILGFGSSTYVGPGGSSAS
jgi:Family of unknown function (DUF5684)